MSKDDPKQHRSAFSARKPVARAGNARLAYQDKRVEVAQESSGKEVVQGFEDIASRAELTWVDDVAAVKNKLTKFVRSVMRQGSNRLRRLVGKQLTASRLLSLGVVVLVVATGFGVKGLVSGNDVKGAVDEQVIVEAPFAVGKADTTEPDAIKFDPANGVASFEDTIGDVQIFISQQPLSGEQINAPAIFLDKVATGLGATTPIDTNFGKAFIKGTDLAAADGQSVVLIATNLLIILRTDSNELATSDWQEYINKIRF